MTTSDRPLVSELSEEELLARIFPLLPRGLDTLLPPGDDAAVVAAPDGRFVVTTDVLVEDRHFRRAWSSGQDVGRRAAVQNLADVAAMGARTTSLVVALVIPAELPVSWVEGLARGLAHECGPQGVGVVGGDLSGGPAVVVAVTAHGDLDGRAPVVRSGARPGDVVAHAGVAGWSAAGLALLDADRLELDHGLVGAYLHPASPLAAGPAAALAGATAMMDVSDGLLRDAGRLARASRVVLALDGPATAFPDDVERLSHAATALGASAHRWVLDGGEDHGLLATFPPDVALPPGFRTIGSVREGAPSVLVDGAPASPTSGWDHFGGR
ncbi:thiamine-phosphate kinase [Cellulomonas sp. URHE0023]|uniref:thiamine-phosphate kinase n=1 Tax=Cellulomonas sp. URHE0023 TaxID=1380354 RepID=UPI0004841824|nr:thiamine-phosphate kinase [Cellulomonas sp. URHE0023]